VLPVGPVTFVSVLTPLLDVTYNEFVEESKDNAPAVVPGVPCEGSTK
jgi:hypothetical protein